VRSLHPGVISATLVGVKYCSSSQDKSYGSKEDSPDAEAVAEGKISLLGTHSDSITGTR